MPSAAPTALAAANPKTGRSPLNGLLPMIASCLRPGAGTTAPSLAAQLAGNALWSTAGAVVSRGLQFLSFIVVARTLGTEGFGRLGLIQSTLGLFSVLGTFGLGLTASRYIAKHRRLDPAKAGRVVSLAHAVATTTGGLAAAILYLGAGWLAGRTLAEPQLAPLLRIASLSLLLTALSATQTGVLSGLEAFKAIAQVNFVSGIAAFPAMLVLVRFFGIAGAIWALNLSLALACALGSVALTRACRDAGLGARVLSLKHDGHILYTFSIPAALSAAMMAPVVWLANAMVVQHANGLFQIGLFNAANTLRTLLLYLPAILIQSSFPVLAAAYSQDGERAEFKSALTLTHNWINVPAVFLGVVSMYSASRILALFGPDYGRGSAAFIVLMTATVIQAMGSGVGATVQVRGDMWYGFSANATWAGVLLLVVWRTAGDSGATALSWGNCVAYAVLLLLQVHKFRQDLPAGMARQICLGLVLLVTVSWGALAGSAGRWTLTRGLLALTLAALMGWITRIRPVEGSARPAQAPAC